MDKRVKYYVFPNEHRGWCSITAGNGDEYISVDMSSKEYGDVPNYVYPEDAKKLFDILTWPLRGQDSVTIAGLDVSEYDTDDPVLMSVTYNAVILDGNDVMLKTPIGDIIVVF